MKTSATKQPEHPLLSEFPDETIDACSDLLAVVISAGRDSVPQDRIGDGAFLILSMVQEALDYEAAARRKWSGG